MYFLKSLFNSHAIGNISVNYIHVIGIISINYIHVIGNISINYIGCEENLNLCDTKIKKYSASFNNILHLLLAHNNFQYSIVSHSLLICNEYYRDADF